METASRHGWFEDTIDNKASFLRRRTKDPISHYRHENVARRTVQTRWCKAMVESTIRCEIMFEAILKTFRRKPEDCVMGNKIPK
eukprot:6465235-Amphidinium_carterae.2